MAASKKTKHTTPRNKRIQSASHRRPNPVSAWWNKHRHALIFSLQRMWINPVAMWITLAAIAIALSLPTSMHVLLTNLKTLTDDKREVPTVTLFLKQQVTEQQAKDVAELLSERHTISNVLVRTRDEALDDFRNISGFAETINTLGENPLPHILIVTPKLSLLGEQKIDIEDFARDLKQVREIDDVQVDIEWIQRLRSILNIANRIILVISILLGITVLLVVGNTIRLDIENRKEEIRVSRLIGATNSYIRRPFLYGGIWLGLFGGILSLVIVHVALLFLVQPVSELAKLYGSNFSLSGVNIFMTLQIIAVSVILGLVGAWLAVSQHLWQSDV